jgi:dnd system-associated protein 4
MKDRVRPPKDLESILDRLKDDGVFETKQKGMMFAAAIGFGLHRNRLATTQLDHFGEGIRLEYFRTSDDDAFIDTLAVAIRNDLTVMALDRQPERIEIFEKFAAIGLAELQRVCYDERPEYQLSGALSLLDALCRSSDEDLPGLANIL